MARKVPGRLKCLQNSTNSTLKIPEIILRSIRWRFFSLDLGREVDCATKFEAIVCMLKSMFPVQTHQYHNHGDHQAQPQPSSFDDLALMSFRNEVICYEHTIPSNYYHYVLRGIFECPFDIASFPLMVLSVHENQQPYVGRIWQDPILLACLPKNLTTNSSSNGLVRNGMVCWRLVTFQVVWTMIMKMTNRTNQTPSSYQPLVTKMLCEGHSTIPNPGSRQRAG